MNLPQDIINIIYTFNADHRKQMKKVLKEIKKTYYIWTYRRCCDYNEYLSWKEEDVVVFNSIYEEKNSNSPFINIIQCVIEMKDHEIKRHLDFWGNCICCRRHIIDKPRISENEYSYYYDQFSEYIDEKYFHGPTYVYSSKFPDRCNCVCRHFSRLIVEAYINDHLI